VDDASNSPSIGRISVAAVSSRPHRRAGVIMVMYGRDGAPMARYIAFEREVLLDLLANITCAMNEVFPRGDVN